MTFYPLLGLRRKPLGGRIKNLLDDWLLQVQIFGSIVCENNNQRFGVSILQSNQQPLKILKSCYFIQLLFNIRSIVIPFKDSCILTWYRIINSFPLIVKFASFFTPRVWRLELSKPNIMIFIILLIRYDTGFFSMAQKRFLYINRFRSHIGNKF